MNKYFIITIDTEEDNQWNYNTEGKTENVKYLPRFQELAEKYQYKPVWLTTYNMLLSDNFVRYFKNKQDAGLCEIGMHLHAWNTPPEYKLKEIEKSRPYLIEYPTKIMEQKIEFLDDMILKKFGRKAVSHRSGRWATNDKYFELITKYGYKIDCSVTPHMNWKRNRGQTGAYGNNYNKSDEKPYWINKRLLEVPVTIRRIHYFTLNNKMSLKEFLLGLNYLIFGKSQWVRPDKSLSVKQITKVIDKCNKNNEYIMFMLHSSELMPGGSPNFKTEESIEKLYEVIENVFRYLNQLGYVGITLKEYYFLYNGGKVNE